MNNNIDIITNNKELQVFVNDDKIMVVDPNIPLSELYGRLVEVGCTNDDSVSFELGDV